MDTSICSRYCSAGILEMLSNITITNLNCKSAYKLDSKQAVRQPLSSSQILWAPAASNSLSSADQQQAGSSSKGLYLSSPYQPCRLTLPPQTNQRRSKTSQRNLTNERGFLPNEGTEISCASAETRFFALLERPVNALACCEN